MKRPQDLSHRELAELVQWLVDKTFMEHDEEGQPLHVYDPENMVDRVDSLNHLAGSLLMKGLAPSDRGDAPPPIEDKDVAELERAERLAREVRDILRKQGTRKAGPRAAALVKSIGATGHLNWRHAMADRRLIVDFPVRRLLLRSGITTAQAEQILDLLDGAEELPEPGGYRPARPEVEISRGVATRPSLTVTPAELVQTQQPEEKQQPAPQAPGAEEPPIEGLDMLEEPGEHARIQWQEADAGARSRALPTVSDLVPPPVEAGE